MEEIWVVEKFERDRTQILGLFSTREKAEKFVSCKFPDWKQNFMGDYVSLNEDEPLTYVSVYSMVLDSEDE